MTSKERAAFRAQANGLEVLFHVGKGGVVDTLAAQTDDALRARELIKLRVLTETAPVTPREAAETLAAATNAEVIQVIGGVIVLYRYNPKLHEEKKPAPVKAAPKKKTAPKKKSPFVDKKGRDKRIKPRGGDNNA